MKLDILIHALVVIIDDKVSGLSFQVLVKLVCNSHTYADKVASLVQEAAYLQANLSSQEGDAASIPVSHIDGEHLKIESK